MISGREAVVLAGGFGTRLADVILDLPKPMAPVAGRPFLRFLLDQLADHTFSRVVIADGYRKECIEEYFGSMYRGMELVYSSEDTPLFTGGAVKQALNLCSAPWVYVFNGDTYLEVDFDKMDNFLSRDADSVTACLAVKEMCDFDRYGTLDIERVSGRITAFHEKKPCKKGFINAGVYLLKNGVLDDYPVKFSLETDYFEKVVDSGSLCAVEMTGCFIDIGIPEDYRFSQTLLAPLAKKWKLALFDRDGTINVDTGHLFEPEKLELIPETIELIREYNEKDDYKVVVVTNQAGIAKGMYTVEQMHDLHRHLDELLGRQNVHIDAYYYCPHHPDYTGSCECRKPRPGMIKKALFDFDADPDSCILYGDKDTDIAAARDAGVCGVQINHEKMGR